MDVLVQGCICTRTHTHVYVYIYVCSLNILGVSAPPISGATKMAHRYFGGLENESPKKLLGLNRVFFRGGGLWAHNISIHAPRTDLN